MKNIIYNTSRQWNCGDEFILSGCLKQMLLMKKKADLQSIEGSKTN